MSVLIENEVGWLVDHQQLINNTYTMTYMFENYRLSDYLAKRTDLISGRQADCLVCQFKAVPELFAIHQSYMMDSQFSKCVNTYQMSGSSDALAKKLDIANCAPVHESADGRMMPSHLRLSVKSKVNILSVIVIHMMLC